MFQGLILAVIGTLLFSLKSIFIKLIYQHGLDAHQVLVLRMLLAFPFYLIILVYLLSHQQHNRQPSVRQVTHILLLGFLGYYLASLLDLMSLTYISAQLERLGLFTYPFLIAILGYLFYGQALTKKLLVALFVSYFGLWLVTGQEQKLTGNNVTLGMILVMGSALSYSLYVLTSHRYIKQIGSQLFTCYAMIGSSIFVLLHALLFTHIDFHSISPEAWFWLILLSIFSTVIPSFMLTEAMRRIGPAQTGLVGSLGPVFTIILAVQFLNEPFTPIMFMGILLVIGGVVLNMFTKNRT